MATDYQSFYYNLSAPPGPFANLYQYSSAYGAQGLMNSTLSLLYSQLVGNQTVRASYIQYYGSGTAALIPKTTTAWNPITSTNWPVFACTISQMDEPDYIQCVNSY